LCDLLTPVLSEEDEMFDVLIHIGLHKTGTSSIQRFLQENRQTLFAEGLIYDCPTKRWPNHHLVATGIRNGQVDSEIRRFLAGLIEGRGERTVLLSSEMFAEADFDVETFRALLDGLRVGVIAYLRNPCDQLVSSYNEVVRDPKIRWMKRITDRPFAYDPSYFTLLSRWLDWGRLTLCPYDRGQWHSGNLLSDFLHVIGADPGRFEISDVRENVSMTADFLEVLRVANGTSISEESRSMIMDILREESGGNPAKSGYPFTVEECQGIIDQLSGRFDLYRGHLRPGFEPDFLFRIPAAARIASE
jgi:hypothetical protein